MSENIFDLQPIKVCIDVHPDGDARGAVITSKKWQPGQTLRVRFLDGDPIVHQKIEAVAHQWSQYANIRFEFGNDPNAEIRISCRTGGSWSYLGKDALGVAQEQPTMNYGWLTPDSSDEEYSRVVLHEFGHALGCIHEHQHPEAGIPWNRDAVYRYYMEVNNWTKEQVDNNLFAQYGKDVTQFSHFDTQSIMLYAIPKELTTNGFEVGWNRYLSDTDKAFMGAIYPPSPGNQVIVYDDSQYQGLAQSLNVGQYDWGQIRNDTISSLRVPPGMKVTLYEHTRFSGRSKTFTQDAPYVGDDFNDLASSIIVESA